MRCTCTYTPTAYGYGGVVEEPARFEMCGSCLDAMLEREAMEEYDLVTEEEEIARERELEAAR
jgi:hypothetical protein